MWLVHRVDAIDSKKLDVSIELGAKRREAEKEAKWYREKVTGRPVGARPVEAPRCVYLLVAREEVRRAFRSNTGRA